MWDTNERFEFIFEFVMKFTLPILNIWRCGDKYRKQNIKYSEYKIFNSNYAQIYYFFFFFFDKQNIKFKTNKKIQN